MSEYGVLDWRLSLLRRPPCQRVTHEWKFRLSSEDVFILPTTNPLHGQRIEGFEEKAVAVRLRLMALVNLASARPRRQEDTSTYLYSYRATLPISIYEGEPSSFRRK